MRLRRGFDDVASSAPGHGGADGAFVSIGNFDGVHRGHRAIADRLVERARAAGRPAVVLTFDPHPIRLLRPEAEPPNLVTLERKAVLLGAIGVDVVIAYPTDRALLELSPTAFFESIVRGRLGAAGLVEGPNFYFGKDRAGDVTTLRELCREVGLSFDVVEPVLVEGEVVSSSRIRALLLRGSVGEAHRLLGHPYRLTGRVTRGAGRGRTIGTPTANLTEIRTLLPAAGVYAGLGVTTSGEFPAAINIGPNPTFGEGATKVEAHLVGFDGDLYETSLHVDLLERIRDVRTFGDVAALESQIANDVRSAVAIADQHRSTGESPC